MRINRSGFLNISDRPDNCNRCMPVGWYFDPFLLVELESGFYAASLPHAFSARHTNINALQWQHQNSCFVVLKSLFRLTSHLEDRLAPNLEIRPQNFQVIFLPHDIMYLVKCTRPFFNKADTKHDVSTPVLPSRDGVLPPLSLKCMNGHYTAVA